LNVPVPPLHPPTLGGERKMLETGSVGVFQYIRPEWKNRSYGKNKGVKKWTRVDRISLAEDIKAGKTAAGIIKPIHKEGS